MARLPSELSTRLAAESKRLADKWEGVFDAYIDGLTELESDGSFTYEDVNPDEMTPGALEELRRRYAGTAKDGWELRTDPANPAEIEFVPRGQAGVSGRLDR
jgi:hypothetical protein